MDNGYSYWMNNLIALDQGLNTLLGGSPDETLSSRTYRMARINEDSNPSSWWCLFEDLVNFLFSFDKGKNGERHCELAYMIEMVGGHMPKSMVRAVLL